ncbi:hypothetical protein JXB28_00230 [Candidatus Woesearchaeota archaeon]|nr:hypothetical protein [Candidatus Woesearchaeota archaeon]
MLIVSGTKKSITPELEELVQEYAVRARKLDKILGVLTKDYCATRCPSAPIGCCDEDHYLQGIDYSLVDIFNQMHQEESKGKIPIGRKPQSACDYHTEHGCVLETKPPVCLGYMCQQLSDNILLRYRLERDLEPRAFDFLNFMDRFHSIKLSKHDSPRLFYYMDKAIVAGNALLGFKNP